MPSCIQNQFCLLSAQQMTKGPNEGPPRRCANFRAQVFYQVYFLRLYVIWKPDGEDTVSVLQVSKSRQNIEAAFFRTGWLQGFHFEAKMDACAHFFLMPPCPRLDSYITPMSCRMQAPANARARSECDHRFYSHWCQNAGSVFDARVLSSACGPCFDIVPVWRNAIQYW